MVDPEDLFFIKGFFNSLLRLTSCFKSVPRFFNDQALKALLTSTMPSDLVLAMVQLRRPDLVVFRLVFLSKLFAVAQGDVMFSIIDIMTLVVEMTGEFLEGLLRAIRPDL